LSNFLLLQIKAHRICWNTTTARST